MSDLTTTTPSLQHRLPPRLQRRTVVVVLLCVAVALLVTYSALSVYKAIDYTTTPAQLLPAQTPETFGLPFEAVEFRSADDEQLQLGGWWIPRADSDRLLILVHGRNGNRASYLALAAPLWTRGYNLLLIDLRGMVSPPPHRVRMACGNAGMSSARSITRVNGASMVPRSA